MKFFETIIIGAGAAGLMCAIEAGKRQKKVLIIDSATKIAGKILISGGGRCNFTNLNISTDNFISKNPNFCISALKRFTQNDFISLVKKHQISYHEKTLGQLFCDISSKQIVNMLLDECEQNKVIIKNETNIFDIEKVENHFVIKTNCDNFQCNSLVIATGGLSIPKMGASDFGYKIAKQFGLKIIQPIPALVPFTLEEEILKKTKILSGVSLLAEVLVGKRKFNEGLLFTHRGLSGPVILQISSYWKKGEKITINLAQKTDIFSWLQNEKLSQPKQEIHNCLAKLLPKSLVFFILTNNKISGNLADLNNKKLQQIATNINNWQIVPSGTEGFAKAEVTLGGVDTNEISSQTFECKKVPNLYFIGEVLDVTGHLGGFNFQWAWSSGFACGQYC